MLWIFVLAIIMPISLANCDSNLAIVKWDHAVNSKAKLDAALKSDVQFIEADVVLGTTTGAVADPAATNSDDETDAEAAVHAVADDLPTNLVDPPKDDKKENKKGAKKGDKEKKPDAKPDAKREGDAEGEGEEETENSNKDIPIMAHPPEVTSDLSLEEFLNTVADYNTKNANTTKGIKLDFKSIEAVEKSIGLLKKDLKAPLWINSDILAGPYESKTTPVDAKKFFEAVKGGKHLDHATLSIGWTTNAPKGVKGNYTQTHVDEMIKAIEDNIKGTSHPITFPVRALFAAESKETLHKLYDHVSKEKNVTFTVWSGAQDEVDSDKLQDFISSFGVEKVYVDVPKDLKDKLKLSSGASSIAAFGVFNVVAMVVALFLRNGLH